MRLVAAHLSHYRPVIRLIHKVDWLKLGIIKNNLKNSKCLDESRYGKCIVRFVHMKENIAKLMLFDFRLISAVCIVVSAEVMANSVDYESEHLTSRHPEGSHYEFGYSYVLVWIVFVIYLIVTLLFLVYSRKRKGENAKSEHEARENEPVHLGRI